MELLVVKALMAMSSDAVKYEEEEEEEELWSHKQISVLTSMVFIYYTVSTTDTK